MNNFTGFGIYNVHSARVWGVNVAIAISNRSGTCAGAKISIPNNVAIVFTKFINTGAIININVITFMNSVKGKNPFLPPDFLAGLGIQSEEAVFGAGGALNGAEIHDVVFDNWYHSRR